MAKTKVESKSKTLSRKTPAPKTQFKKITNKKIKELIEKHKAAQYIWSDVAKDLDVDTNQLRKHCRLYRKDVWDCFIFFHDRMDISDEEIKDEIYQKLGLITEVSKSIGIPFTILRKRMRMNDDLMLACDHARIRVIDLTMASLFANIRKGNQRAIEYYLDHIAEELGFGRKRNVAELESGQVSDPIQERLDQLTEDQLRQLGKCIDEQRKIIDITASSD